MPQNASGQIQLSNDIGHQRLGCWTVVQLLNLARFISTHIDAISANDALRAKEPANATTKPQTRDEGPPFSKPAWNVLTGHELVSDE